MCPSIAQIAGNCMGAGEIASLRHPPGGPGRAWRADCQAGFPMAPREAEPGGARGSGDTAREMLLEAGGAGRPDGRAAFCTACCTMPTLRREAQHGPAHHAPMPPLAARLEQTDHCARSSGPEGDRAQNADGRPTPMPTAPSTARASPPSGESAQRFEPPFFLPMSNQNLFVALRAAFPPTWSSTAVETDDGGGRSYTWRDLDRASAMVANLLVRWTCPRAAAASRCRWKNRSRPCCCTWPRCARLHVLAAQHRLPERRDRILHRQCRAGGGGLHARNFGWSAKSPLPPVRSMCSRWATTAPAACWSGPRTIGDDHVPVARGAATTWPPSSTPAAPPAQQGRDADARQPAVQRGDAEGLLGLGAGRRADPRLPIFHVHGLFVAIHGALLNGSKMIWLAKFDPRRSSPPWRGHRVHGRAHAVRAHAGRAG